MSDFESQFSGFDFSKTNNIKVHLGANAIEDESDFYLVLERYMHRADSIMIDYNCGYNLSALVDIQNVLLRYPNLSNKLLWVEEPTHPNFSKYWKDLLFFECAAGENHHGVESLFQLTNCNVKYIMPDLGRTLKVSELPSLIKRLEKSDSSISFHSFSSGFLSYITLYLTLSLDTKHQMFEYDFSDNALLDEILLDSFQIKDGYVTLNSSVLFDLNLPSTLDGWYTTSIELFEA
ncbi:enolase C-terminal domain-like protein [Synechococcus sp. A15-28]|uniref:enolase C-terminal domain-like protein n=1 Tax=Synechococcus sp. A15-28 TaxID=1050638 RepID=UPI0016444491|nr:enolase C-terminal domain-like protein [Synechococcus sp. A15-28]